jgi:gamma-glutamyltranspeptidase/glutathione hydrolase
VESLFGSGILAPGTGILLNNELTDFDAVPGGPNEVAPGKRPRSSMTPTILFKDGEPIAAYGSPGGAGIISSVFNVTLNLIDHGMGIKEAVEAPRISVTSPAGAISREAGFDEAEIQKLRDLGHTVNPPGNIGNVNAVVIDPKTGEMFGATDTTREGGLIGLPR